MTNRELNLTAVEAFNPEAFHALLADFETESGVHVDLHLVSWETYRAEFVNIALQRRPVDVSVVGTPITSDLVGMNVLRPFSPAEINGLGGEKAFLPARWQSGIRPGNAQQWAIPWMLDIRMLYYWRDMLASAEVDEDAAFQNHESVKNTLRALSHNSIERPFSLPLERYALLHAVSSWIWSNGGRLFQPDGKQVTFHEQAGLEAMQQFLSLHAFIAKSGAGLLHDPRFMARKSAISLGNGWLVSRPNDPNLGCTPVLGQSYLGGPDLIVWAQSRNESAALELVRFLTRPEIQMRISRESGLLPVNVQELDCLGDTAPALKVLSQAAHSGRTFPCVPMIGLVEDRLSTALLQIQQELINNPNSDIETLLLTRILPLGHRINLSLS